MQTPVKTAYLSDELSRKKLLLLGSLPGQQVAQLLPKLDEELLIRAEEAFASGDSLRCSHLLDAMEHQDFPRWHLLRGSLYMAKKQWQAAIAQLLAAEEAFPQEVWPRLETCYRETENFRKAYEYACKQKK